MKNAKRLLKKLDYLPRWAWYLISFFIAGPFGPLAVYLAFYALNKAAQDEADEETYGWNARGGHIFGHKSDAYQDADCIVTSDDDIDAQWTRTEESARKADGRSFSWTFTWESGKKDKKEDQKDKKEKTKKAKQDKAESSAHDSEGAPDTGSADCDSVIREGREAMRLIRRANDLIPDPALSAQIDSIENSCGQILTLLEQRPEILSQLRTFLRYYLPTTLKLLDARARLENTANTPKAREVRARISEAVGVIDKAFLKQVEALDEYRFIDLESEMDVLRDMLRADGLIVEDEEAEEDDPFADVMASYNPRGARRQGKDDDRNLPMATH